MANRNPKKMELMPAWKPGQSGNPSGRPRTKPISDRYAYIAERELGTRNYAAMEFWTRKIEWSTRGRTDKPNHETKRTKVRGHPFSRRAVAYFVGVTTSTAVNNWTEIRVRNF